MIFCWGEIEGGGGEMRGGIFEERKDKRTGK